MLQLAPSHLCKANVLAMHAILEVNPNAIFIQSESSEYFHADKPACLDKARQYNEKRFLSLDLTYGHPLNYEMYEYLLDNGMTREDYHWFIRNHRKSHCVMGNDYYVTNEHLVREDDTVEPSGEEFPTITEFWLVEPAPGGRTIQRWHLRFIHGYGGHVGQSFLLEKHRASGQTNLVRLPPPLARHPLSPPAPAVAS